MIYIKQKVLLEMHENTILKSGINYFHFKIIQYGYL